jgi:hypothetical protein
MSTFGLENQHWFINVDPNIDIYVYGSKYKGSDTPTFYIDGIKIAIALLQFKESSEYYINFDVRNHCYGHSKCIKTCGGDTIDSLEIVFNDDRFEILKKLFVDATKIQLYALCLDSFIGKENNLYINLYTPNNIYYCKIYENTYKNKHWPYCRTNKTIYAFKYWIYCRESLIISYMDMYKNSNNKIIEAIEREKICRIDDYKRITGRL